MKYEVVEAYDGRVTVLETTDCPGDAERLRLWHAEQWACLQTALKSIWVRRKA